MSPNPAQIRAVTAESIEAIRSTAGRTAGVTTHSEPPSFVDLLLERPAAEDISAKVRDSAEADSLRKRLGEIGHRHKLSVAETTSKGALRLDFSEIGIRTHTIRLQFPEDASPVIASVTPFVAATGSPRLAIIVDDMGNDRDAANSLLALAVPLTLSVLPDLPFSKEVADAVAGRGDEVMLHLPMQPESESVPSETPELRDGMSAEQVRAALAHMLASVPHVSGVNNHEGSRATSNPALMDDLMPALRERGLFFIDSRTAATTVAFRTAQHYGVRSAARKVFLDDTVTHEAISQQLNLAVTEAQRDGTAIAIGHPHPETIAVLHDQLPSLRQRGVQLVFASDLAH
jgi:polysaccharide deacetylase 2 family uncharacterized protein YibQ